MGPFCEGCQLIPFLYRLLTVYLSLYLSLSLSLSLSLCVCVFVCMCVSVLTNVCLCICACTCIHVRVSVYMHECGYLWVISVCLLGLFLRCNPQCKWNSLQILRRTGQNFPTNLARDTRISMRSLVVLSTNFFLLFLLLHPQWALMLRC